MNIDDCTKEGQTQKERNLNRKSNRCGLGLSYDSRSYLFVDQLLLLSVLQGFVLPCFFTGILHH